MWAPILEDEQNIMNYYPGSNPHSLYYDLNDYFEYQQKEINKRKVISKHETLLDKMVNLFDTTEEKIMFLKDVQALFNRCNTKVNQKIDNVSNQKKI